MPFKKLKPLLKDILEDLNIEEATAFQKNTIPKIKSGANVFAIGPEKSGRTTTLILTTLHKLKDYEDRTENDNHSFKNWLYLYKHWNKNPKLRKHEHRKPIVICCYPRGKANSELQDQIDF